MVQKLLFENVSLSVPNKMLQSGAAHVYSLPPNDSSDTNSRHKMLLEEPLF